MSTARRRPGPLLAMLLAALVSTACATAIEGRASPADPGGPLTTAPAAPTPTGPARPTSTPEPGGVPLVIDPVVPGWNVVRSVNRAAAYDVPPDWNVRSEDTIIGYEDSAGNRVASTGAATFGDDACGEFSNLALSVVRHDVGTDLTGSATIIAESWAALAYSDENDVRPTLSTAPPESLTTATGLPAALVVTTATLPAPNPECGTTEGKAYALAATEFTGELGPTVILLVVADVDSPGAASEADIRKILTSLRPA